jgi:hypothetical protein
VRRWCDEKVGVTKGGVLERFFEEFTTPMFPALLDIAYAYMHTFIHI